MPSETFYCPSCRRQLTKSAQAYVMGEMMSSKNSRGIFMGDMSAPISCPGCGAAINAQKMIMGEYDKTGGSASGFLGFLFFAGAWFAICAIYRQPWWAGLIGGLVAWGLVEWIAGKMTAKKPR